MLQTVSLTFVSRFYNWIPNQVVSPLFMNILTTAGEIGEHMDALLICTQ